jgi:tryptophanyl-tRNA synthetase
MSMYTDPAKARATDPGHPDGCIVFAMHKLYADKDFAVRREAECKAGSLGCVACKKDALAFMDGPFSAFRANREKYDKPGLVEEILEKGSRKSEEIAERTMERVRKAMNLR